MHRRKSAFSTPAQTPRFSFGALALGALACCLASGPRDAAATPEQSTPPAPGVPKGATFKATRAEVERDLVLEIRRTNNEPFEEAKDPRLDVFLVNRSRSRSYPVVLPSDGSEAGFREPKVSFSVERQTAAGAWQDAPEPPGARCGNYDEDWAKDVVTLAPGAARKLGWYRFPTRAQAGDSKKVRVVARYAYAEGKADKRTPPPRMAKMPSFELASAPLELDVARPLALGLSLRAPLPRLGGSALAPSIDVYVENKGPSPLPFATADVASLSFEAELERASDSVKTRTITVDAESATLGAARDTIAPGGRRSALTASTKTHKLDGFGVVPPGEQIARLRARYLLAYEDAQGPNMRLLVSPWVPVTPALRPR